MKTTFDPAKRSESLTHRGLDMADAGSVFAGSTITIADDRRDYGEERFISVGYLAGRMVVLVWTPRENSKRIISLRKANAREQSIYKDRLA